MRRGILLVAALLAAALPTPATAAAPVGVAYEVVRLRASAPRTVTVTFHYDAGPHAGIAMFQLLQRREGRWAADGGGLTAGGADGWVGVRFDSSTGHRLFGAGIRGQFRVELSAPGWGVRAVPGGFRAVAPEPEGAAGTRTMRAAKAAAGRYGSTAFAAVPCAPGAGTWTLRTGSDVRGGVCPLGSDSTWAFARSGGEWVVEGDVTGRQRWPYRLVVLDFPKP